MLGAEGLLKSVIFWGMQHVPRLLLVSYTVWCLKLPSPQVQSLYSTFQVCGPTREMLKEWILWSWGWGDGLIPCIFFHLVTRRTAWLDLDLNYLPVFPAPVNDLAVEKNNYCGSVATTRKSYKTGLCKNSFPQVTHFQSLYQSICNSHFKVMEIITNIE